ncbi:MAG TPA: hypothetical protein VN436_10765, partial [Holophaga sp.]|nr:hypothetical protein [Holophaga sp.]
LGLVVSRRAPSILLLLAAAVPSVAILSSQSDLRPIVSWRHLITVLPAVFVFCGAGAAWLAGLLGRLVPRRLGAGAALVSTFALCALVASPTLFRLDEYYARTLSHDRDLFRFLGRLPTDGAALVFTGYQRNAKTFAARWHLPERFAGPGDFSGPGIGRVLVANQFIAPSQRRQALPPGTLLESWRVGAVNSRVALAGLPRRAPLLLAPGADGRALYADDFRDWRYYNDAFASTNFTVDTEVGLLRPTRYEAPATACWRFDLPGTDGRAIVRATVSAALYKRHPDVAADAVLTIAGSADGRTFAPLARLTHADFLTPDGVPRTAPCRSFEEASFYQECRTASTVLDLSSLADGGTVYLRVEYAPGVREGFLNVAGIQ